MKPHDWQQVTVCCNGPHVWKCKKCGEWTRSFDKPSSHAQLIDPENGESYSDWRSSYGPEDKKTESIDTSKSIDILIKKGFIYKNISRITGKTQEYLRKVHSEIETISYEI